MKKQRICIVGDGLSGLMTALALNKLESLEVLLISRKNKHSNDRRTTAISASNYDFFNKVIDKYEAEVEVLESSRKANDGGDILRLDQDDLETVIPKELGEKVRILVGKHRGKKARVIRLNKEDYHDY